MKPFNVIVTDIHMPVLNGFELTKQIRQLEKEQNLPATIIIGISGNSTEEIALQAQQCGRSTLTQPCGYLFNPTITITETYPYPNLTPP